MSTGHSIKPVTRPAAGARRYKTRVLVAVCTGNTFEWFDFVIFGYFASTISKQFFPAEDPASAILLTFAVFGVAFAMRPLGAIAGGYYADRHGRKPGLTLTISLMTLGTSLIAFAPTYATVGPFAPFIVLSGRILQGLSAGGEFGSATALLVEQDSHRRGFFASWQFASQALAIVIITAGGTVLSNVLELRQIDSWGWRIPFVFGTLIGLIAIYIRRRISESHEFELSELSNSPLREILSQFKTCLVIASSLVTVVTVGIYTLLFMPTFAMQHLSYSMADALLVSLITGCVQMVVVPIAGAASDRWGPLRIASPAASAILVTTIPLLAHAISNPTFANLLIFQVWIGAQVAIYAGALSPLITDLFPTRIRTTGLSVSYSLAVAFFGGFAPFVSEFLVRLFESKIASGYYLVLAATLSLVALFAVHRQNKRANLNSN